MFIYIVRNKWDGQIIQPCATREIAEKFASRIKDAYVDEFILITALN